MSTKPQAITTRIKGHWSSCGGEHSGSPYEVTCLWVRVPGTACWILADQQPTPQDGSLPPFLLGAP